MRGVRLNFDVAVESLPMIAMPPNCETVGRVYVGDECFGLIREPHDRGLFLVSRESCFAVNVPMLLAGFADAVTSWNRERGFIDAVRGPRRTEADERAHKAAAPLPRPRQVKASRTAAAKRGKGKAA